MEETLPHTLGSNLATQIPFLHGILSTLFNTGYYTVYDTRFKTTICHVNNAIFWIRNYVTSSLFWIRIIISLFEMGVVFFFFFDTSFDWLVCAMTGGEGVDHGIGEPLKPYKKGIE